jgi:TonB family protein
LPGHQHKKDFLKLPEYPGGARNFKEFITRNLVYPKDALEAGVEGTVLVEYGVNDNGKVISPRVLKGLGHGCDEEALRLIGLLSYEKVKNRGVRVKVTTKTRILFTLPKVTINYTAPEKKDTGKKSPGKDSYEYTISF